MEAMRLGSAMLRRVRSRGSPINRRGFTYDNRLRPLFLTTNRRIRAVRRFCSSITPGMATARWRLTPKIFPVRSTADSYTLFQNFSYDHVARLTSVTEQAPSTAVNWARNFSYDPYGNMWEGCSTNPGVPFTGDTPTANNYTTKNQRPDRAYDNAETR